MKIHSYLIASLLIAAMPLVGQPITVDSPVSRMVFQRSALNTAVVPVTGRVQAAAAKVRGRLVARQGGQTTEWREGTVNNGTFRINIPALGGYYDLEVVALAGSTEIDRQRRERIGVGEVFVVAGQSNNFGEAGKGLAASDDRVSVVNYWPGYDGNVDQNALPMAFAQAGPGTFCGPRNPLYIWGGLGDRLAAALNVPVLFLGAAQPGSSTNNWREAALGAEDVSGRSWTNNIPYRPLRLALQVYGQKTGLRGVLWHQGESDNGYQDADGYFANMKTVIGKSRWDSGFLTLSWMIARASYYPFNPGHETDAGVIAGQNRIIREINNCFGGPETDAFTGPAYRSDQLHFSENAYNWLADRWAASLNTAYFQQATPSLPNVGPLSPVVSQPTQPGPSLLAALTLTAPTYDCRAGTLVFNTVGGTTDPIEYMAPGITGWTTNPRQVISAGLLADPKPLTLWARQAGNTVSFLFDLRQACSNSSATAPTTTPNAKPDDLLKLVEPLYNCATGFIRFQTTGGDSTRIEFMAAGITTWSDSAVHLLSSGLRYDPKSIMLRARQSGREVALDWDMRSTCPKTARFGIESDSPTAEWTVSPNPTAGDVLLRVPGIETMNPASRLVSLLGQEIPVHPVIMADGLTLDLRQLPAGIYLWHVFLQNKPAKTVRVVKID